MDVDAGDGSSTNYRSRLVVQVQVSSRTAEAAAIRSISYSTRDAAQNWEHAYVDFLIEQGFASGLTTPCIFYNVRDLRIVVNGDDFTVLGSNSQLDWFRQCTSQRPA